MKKIIFILFIFVFFGSYMFSQDTVFFVPNEQKSITLSFCDSNIDINSATITIKISNPTCFYIDKILLADQELPINNDYGIIVSSIDFCNINTNEITIIGTGLSGNDTSTRMSVNLKLNASNSIIQKELDYNIVINSQQNLYSKFAHISSMYPNPTSYQSYLTIIFINDIDDNFDIKIFNEIGKLEYVHNAHFESGKHTITIPTSAFTTSGTHLLCFNSKTGSIYIKFMVLR